MKKSYLKAFEVVSFILLIGLLLAGVRGGISFIKSIAPAKSSLIYKEEPKQFISQEPEQLDLETPEEPVDESETRGRRG